MPKDIQEIPQNYIRINGDSFQSSKVSITRDKFSDYSGAEGYDFSFVNVEITKGGRRKTIRMFSKSIDPSLGVVSTQEILKRHHSLKKLGFPVPNTLRISEDGLHILMTDMTRNDQFEIIDRHNLDSSLQINNLDEVKDEVLKIAKKGEENDYIFGYDAYAVVVDKKTNLGHVIILDIGSGIHNQNRLQSMYQENQTQSFKDYVKQISQNSAETFIGALELRNN